ncbi:MAG: PC4/YdbC family ssDNA-binding protein [Thomasclavelia ramosa]|nr:hypothetical protein DWV50_08315 [Coprobacillus sp. AF09-1A]
MIMEFEYKLIDKLATISTHNNITKELNIIAFGSGEPVYDLRKWDRSKDRMLNRMLKGISFTKDELVELKQILENIDV